MNVVLYQCYLVVSSSALEGHKNGYRVHDVIKSPETFFSALAPITLHLSIFRISILQNPTPVAADVH
jgi:hypothetical protein